MGVWLKTKIKQQLENTSKNAINKKNLSRFFKKNNDLR